MARRRPTRSLPEPPPREVRVRGHAYARSSDASPLAPRPVPARSRTRASEVTFALRGRLVCTAVLAAPTVVFLLRGTLFWLMLMFWSWVVAGTALRDVWRAVEAVEPAEGGHRPSTR